MFKNHKISGDSMTYVTKTDSLLSSEYFVDPETLYVCEKNEDDKYGSNTPRICLKSSQLVSGAVQAVMEGCMRLENQNQLPPGSCSEVFLAAHHALEKGAADDASWHQVKVEENSSRAALSERISRATLPPPDLRFPPQKELEACLKQHPLISDNPYLIEKGFIQSVANDFANQEKAVKDVELGVAARALVLLQPPTFTLGVIQMNVVQALEDCANAQST